MLPICCWFNKVDLVEFNFVASVYRALQRRNNYSATANDMKFVHWPLMGGLLHLDDLVFVFGPSSLCQM